jgi:hypothetical protein
MSERSRATPAVSLLRLPPIFWHLFNWHLFKKSKAVHRGSDEAQAADSLGGRMNNEAMKEVLNELFSHLERLETQNEAILQFLKEKKRVPDKNASSVKWRAARVRIDHLLEPEHPEKEIKLGKKLELHEDSSRRIIRRRLVHSVSWRQSGIVERKRQQARKRPGSRGGASASGGC